MEDFTTWIEEQIRARLRDYDAKIETVCEQSIQQGTCGVMVDHNDERIAWVSDKVPYGHLWDVTACGESGIKD